MTQRDSRTYRNVGSAQRRYVDLERIGDRDQIAEWIRQRAREYEQLSLQTGEAGLKTKADRLMKQAFRYRYCSYEYLLLACVSCGQKYIGRLRCECRICAQCSKKHYYQIKAKLHELTKELTCKGSKRLMFLTLTLKVHTDAEITSSDVRELFKHVRKLVNRLYPRSDGSGALAVFEMGKKLNLHVHLIVYGDYVPQETISGLWHRITGNSYVVDIREVKQRKRQINYVLKYIHKPHKGSSPEDAARYLDIITGVRRVHTFGIFYGTRFSQAEPCPCFFCGGKLGFTGTDGGLEIPADALFFDEAVRIAKTSVN